MFITLCKARNNVRKKLWHALDVVALENFFYCWEQKKKKNVPCRVREGWTQLTERVDAGEDLVASDGMHGSATDVCRENSVLQDLANELVSLRKKKHAQNP